MKVSVCITTYNHAQFIRQALDSVLMQKTSFPFEIIIGEDASDDGTREVVRQYALNYPQQIRLFLNDRNNLIYINGRPTGRWNFMNNLQNAKGEFIALLEGDDYWVSDHKLQRQVDFLDTNPQCVLCFHPVKEIIEATDIPARVRTPIIKQDFYNLGDLFIFDNFVPTCSVVYRNGCFDHFPEWYKQVPYGDWALHVINAQYGSIGYIDEIMGVYRIHPGGVWSNRDLIDRLKTSMETQKLVASKLHLTDQGFFRQARSRTHFRLGMAYQRTGKKSLAWLHAWSGFLCYPFEKNFFSLKKLVLIIMPVLKRFQR